MYRQWARARGAARNSLSFWTDYDNDYDRVMMMIYMSHIFLNFFPEQNVEYINTE